MNNRGSKGSVSARQNQGDHQQKRTKTRRKQKRANRRVSVIFQCLLTVLIGIGLWSLWNHPFWRIKDTHISGLSQYNQRFILNYFHQNELNGQHLLTINPLAIREEMLNYPLLEEVIIERYLWPARLEMHITERLPLFRIYLETAEGYTDKNSFLIDKEGMILPIPFNIKPQNTLKLSIEPSQAKRIMTEVLDVIYKLNTYYENKLVSVEGVFNISNANNVILNTPKAPVPVWLGTLDDLPIKIGLLESISALINDYPNQVKYIDLRFWKHPVLKML